MMRNALKDNIIDLIREPLAGEGCELADVVLSQYKGTATLRLFVYSENGATLDECARLSRLVGDLIDGTDYLEDGYTLEVSTPGLDRPLTQAIDYRYRVGEKVKIEFVEKKRKKREAEIVSANGQEIEFRDESGSFTVPLAEVKQAKIVF